MPDWQGNTYTYTVKYHLDHEEFYPNDERRWCIVSRYGSSNPQPIDDALLWFLIFLRKRSKHMIRIIYNPHFDDLIRQLIEHDVEFTLE